jgi:hypothetical protein
MQYFGGITVNCLECGQQMSREEAHLLISAAGLSGHVTSCHVCATCHDEARKTGAAGPNVTRAGYASANAAKAKRDTTPLAQLGWGRR